MTRTSCCTRPTSSWPTPPFNVDEVDADKIKNDPRLRADAQAFTASLAPLDTWWAAAGCDNVTLLQAGEKAKTLADTSRDLLKDVDQLYKPAARLVDAVTTVRPEPVEGPAHTVNARDAVRSAWRLCVRCG